MVKDMGSRIHNERYSKVHQVYNRIHNKVYNKLYMENFDSTS